MAETIITVRYWINMAERSLPSLLMISWANCCQSISNSALSYREAKFFSDKASHHLSSIRGTNLLRRIVLFSGLHEILFFSKKPDNELNPPELEKFNSCHGKLIWFEICTSKFPSILLVLQSQNRTWTDSSF